VRFEVIKMMKAAVVWVERLCSLVEIYWHFGRTSNPHDQGRRVCHVRPIG